MKMQRDVSVNGDKERTAKGSQLTRVVPPSFSVPFICDGESKVRCFFYYTLTVTRDTSDRRMCSQDKTMKLGTLRIWWSKGFAGKEKEKRDMAKEKLVKNITSRDENFAQWYTDVVREAELCDYSSVKGI